LQTQNEKLLSFLGLAKRANALSFGHNACIRAVRSKQAKLCLVSSDASQRLFEEFDFFKELKCLRLPLSMEELSHSLKSRAGVMVINDENLAKAISGCISSQT
jgi:ribosomal protein L30E